MCAESGAAVWVLAGQCDPFWPLIRPGLAAGSSPACNDGGGASTSACRANGASVLAGTGVAGCSSRVGSVGSDAGSVADSGPRRLGCSPATSRSSTDFFSRVRVRVAGCATGCAGSAACAAVGACSADFFPDPASAALAAAAPLKPVLAVWPPPCGPSPPLPGDAASDGTPANASMRNSDISRPARGSGASGRSR